MIVELHRDFKKQLRKLSPKLQARVYEVLELFERNPFARELENHPLSGKMRSKRAISVTGSYRIIFIEERNYYYVLMLDVGTHPQVYG